MPDLIAVFADFSVLRVLGILGFIIYVMLYMSLAMRWLSSDSIAYFLGCILAASLVLASLAEDFNLGSALIQIFWIIMGVPAVIIRLARQRSNRRAMQAVHLTSSQLSH